MIERTDPGHPEAAAILRQYVVELVERYHERSTTDDEIDALLVEHGNDDLRPPTGLFLLVRDGDGDWAGDGQTGTIIGCVGLRWLDSETSELTRMFVRPDARRRGVASRLINAAEDEARTAGAKRMRLDTRTDLVEARALYARHGYAEIEDYNDGFFADHWFEKTLV